MGNSQHTHSKGSESSQTPPVSRARKQIGHILTSINQLSAASFTFSFNGASFLSQNSRQSSYSVTRPWSRVSRRRWQESTLSNSWALSKTAWPVAQVEAAFLPEFRIGSEVSNDSFEVLSEISKGAFGVVYKVMKKDSKELFAMKILQKYQIINDKAVQQVKNEVKIQSMCGHHPFVVNCPYYWQTKRELFIVSDYVEGGELSDLLNKFAPFSDELAKIYIAELALAIDFLHNAGVIYRDLKPENILLDCDGHIQIIDFGLSKWLPYNARTGTICGTFQYMAPEIFSPELYSHAVDWWSLGVVACRLLTNQVRGYHSRTVFKLTLVSLPLHEYSLTILCS
ncbi:serine/threonine-protein kinase S6KL isoform X3 [Bemisia tabaci]|uniref:serine/threonine-protein kinase S6KL isoform X3 n=1 Tax=Bemisia tabaci TaxID=7038 RepID=UPI003B27CC48